jgi:predicted DNA repair protein MutK
MAGASLLALLDDIATILDDVAVMTKVAAKKTAGVLGDDLALNAEQVSGVRAERELPVVWAVAKGSLVNKAILVPTALAISAVAPMLVIPLLMIGGLYLCYEGVEKLAHKWLHRGEAEVEHQAELAAVADESVDLVAYEKEKIKGAIRTDFVLSAEILVIALGTVADKPFATQAAVMVGIALIMTAGVYGLVAGIVKMDDVGAHLVQKPAAVAQAVGRLLLAAAPKIMRALTVIGTLAMFLVGGGILTHGVPPLHHLLEGVSAAAGFVGPLVGAVLDALVGVVAGAVVLAAMTLIVRIRGTRGTSAT